MTSTEVEARNAAIDLICALADGGYLRIYGANRALLAELRLDTPAFKPAQNGEAKSNPISPETNAPKTGKALRYSVVKSDGNSTVWDGDVSERGKGGSLQLDSVAIHAGAEVSISSVTYSMAAT